MTMVTITTRLMMMMMMMMMLTMVMMMRIFYTMTSLCFYKTIFVAVGLRS